MSTESAKPTLIVTGDYRLYVADAIGVAEVHIPAIAKALYLMILSHRDGVCFDESFKARKELIEVYYDITHSPLDEDELCRVLSLTEPPMGDIVDASEVIRQAFIAAVGDERATPFAVDYSNPNAVRVAVPSVFSLAKTLACSEG